MGKLFSSISLNLDKFTKLKSYQYIVIVLVILNCMCIIADMALEYIEFSILADDYIKLKEYCIENQNLKSVAIYHQLLEINKIIVVNQSYTLYLRLASKYIKHFGFVISVVFMIELAVKIVFIAKELLRTVWEIIDFLAILVNFSIDIAGFFIKFEALSVIGLITLLRYVNSTIYRVLYNFKSFKILYLYIYRRSKLLIYL